MPELYLTKQVPLILIIHKQWITPMNHRFPCMTVINMCVHSRALLLLIHHSHMTQNLPLNYMADEWLLTHRQSMTEHCLDESLLHIMQQGQLQQRQLLSAIQIPKVELMCFDRDPLKYWGFIQMFDNSMDKDTIDSCSKLSRLLQ